MQGKRKLFLLTLLAVAALIYVKGCSGVKEEEIKGYVSESYIYSNNKILFYKIYGGRGYSYFKIKKEESYLCVHLVGGAIADQCLDFGTKGEILPEGTRIHIMGDIIKTEKWGISTIDSGPSPMTQYRGIFDNNETIWVGGQELFFILEKEAMLPTKNNDAYHKIKDKEVWFKRFDAMKKSSKNNCFQKYKDEENYFLSFNCKA